MKAGIYQRYGKRFMDLLLALIAIILLLPVLIILAIVVRIFIGSPILFKQRRPGLKEKLFTIYKFRTMSEQKNAQGELLPDAERLNKIGKFLRATSLDELPELFNILRGNMSIVGPRPLLEQYLPLYNESQRRRHEVRPGLTGLAQIKGRNTVHWTDRFQLDLEYMEHISFLGDIKIMLFTVKKVLKREGIHSETAVTMEPFTGNQEEKNKEDTPKSQLLIIGAGGHGKVVADVAMKMKHWSHIAFLDDNTTLHSVMNIPVIGTTEEVSKYIDQYDIFVAIGNNKTRETLTATLENAGATIPTLIHPSAIIGEQVSIHVGTVIMAGTVMNCCTHIGRGCIINTGATIDHDNEIEDYVHVSPGVHTAGKVKVGTRTWLGIGSIVKNNVSIQKDCLIGAGAVVVKDIQEEGTYIGVPAKHIT